MFDDRGDDGDYSLLIQYDSSGCFSDEEKGCYFLEGKLGSDNSFTVDSMIHVGLTFWNSECDWEEDKRKIKGDEFDDVNSRASDTIENFFEHSEKARKRRDSFLSSKQSLMYQQHSKFYHNLGSIRGR